MTETATTIQPIPGEIPTLLPKGYDLADVGYLDEEYLFEGVASSYRQVGDRGADGRWQTETDVTAPFRTRLLVRRPADLTRFSGTVLVEWLNVSGGVDAAPDWGYLHRHITRRGDAWIGVSAQKAGIDGGGVVETLHLKLWQPDRYAILDHPGDAFAYDIFSEVGRVVRSGAPTSPLGSLEPTRILAIGESQSAMFLTTYINAIDATAGVYDGFLVHGRPAAAVGLGGPEATNVAGMATAMGSPHGEQIRSDARVPVIVLQSETDVVLMGGARTEQPDGDRVRLWEIAGSAHADTYMLMASHYDGGALPADELAERLRAVSNVMGMPCGRPINAGPQQHYVAQAALEHLDRWAAGGDPPPFAARLDLTDARDDFVRDANGLATGGVRTPWVDVPTAVLSGLGQTGEMFSVLFGTTAPFDAEQFDTLYPGGDADYLARFTESLDATIAAGFILEADREEILAVATATRSAGR